MQVIPDYVRITKLLKIVMISYTNQYEERQNFEQAFLNLISYVCIPLIGGTSLNAFTCLIKNETRDILQQFVKSRAFQQN